MSLARKSIMFLFAMGVISLIGCAQRIPATMAVSAGFVLLAVGICIIGLELGREASK